MFLWHTTLSREKRVRKIRCSGTLKIDPNYSFRSLYIVIRYNLSYYIIDIVIRYVIYHINHAYISVAIHASRNMIQNYSATHDISFM